MLPAVDSSAYDFPSSRHARRVEDRNSTRTDAGADKKLRERLDYNDNNKMLRGQMADWFAQARMAQTESRLQMAYDEDNADGNQWHDDEIQALRDRRQYPLVFNHIKESLDWIKGVQRTSKAEGSVLPREDGDVDSAHAKQHLLKYLDDINHGAYQRTLCFEEGITAGLSWAGGRDTLRPL